MVDKEESESSIRNNRPTYPFMIPFVASGMAAIQYGYMSGFIVNPIMLKMQFVNASKEEFDKDTVHFKFLLLLPIFIQLGGFLGVFVWGYLADRYGRKPSLLISHGICICSSAILSFDRIIQRFEFRFFARCCIGIATGALVYSVPLYTLEISSLNVRGALGTMLVLLYAWGYILCEILTTPQVWGNEENYLFLMGATCLFSIISTAFLVPSPESPRFLYLQRNDKEKAREVLKKLRGEENVEDEMEELREEYYADSRQKNMNIWKILCFRPLRWQIITVVILVTGSRLMQTNVVIIFAQDSYRVLKLSAKASRLLPLAGSLVIQLMILTTVFTVDALGRRFLLLTGFLICVLSSIALVFTTQISTPSLAFLSILLVFLFFIGYAMGAASIIPMIIGEFFLQSSRASGYVVAGIVTWAIRCFSALLFLLTKSYLETYFLLLYWPSMVIAFIYILRIMPETSGKTFQEIQEDLAACTSKNSRTIAAE